MQWMTCVARMQTEYIKSDITLNYFTDTNFEIVVR
jgi:hypothetical protein